MLQKLNISLNILIPFIKFKKSILHNDFYLKSTNKLLEIYKNFYDLLLTFQYLRERIHNAKSKNNFNKKDFVYGKYVIGIDPDKAFHQAAILQFGKSFSFRNSHSGFANLLKKVRQKIPEFSNENTIIAIETSCNLWQVPLRFFTALNFKTVLVSPLSTKHARPLLAHKFSHTDPKDAYLGAGNAQKGYFDQVHQICRAPKTYTSH